ncbi:DUF885 family protein [Sphingomonas leidyi]|uniref:DUF885 family protein n=1 Tax=Sphingomonas leidyi TaxID=68569 RepID=UPI0036D2B065
MNGRGPASRRILRWPTSTSIRSWRAISARPAGAVAYKVGELRIVALRHRAEAALGDRFDIRAFHDLILAQGQLPMTMLETVVDDWIAARK